MSKIVLGWRLDRPVQDDHVHETIVRVEERYQPLFQDRIRHSGLWSRDQGLLHFDVRTAPDPGLHLTGELVACLTGKPAQASVRSTASVDAKSLYEEFASAPEILQNSLLGEIDPPFTLCWFDQAREQIGIVHDGLGEDQFFIAEAGNGIVFSNKCWPILQFLGMPPRIAHSAWKYWFSMGWFPGLSTPFENIRVLDEGEIIAANAAGMKSRKANVLSRWLSPSLPAGARAPMLGALDTFRKIIRQSSWGGDLQTDLTAGLDTRTICAVLVKEQLPCRFFTGGPRFSPDVEVARDLARKFGLQWTHVPSSTRSGARRAAETVQTQIRRMVLWSEGLVEPLRFSHFRDEPAPTSLGTYLSGGSSEISKAHYYGNSLRKSPAERFDLERYLRNFKLQREPLTTERDTSELMDLIRTQIARGESYDLGGFALLDWFYLTERVRRWQSAHIAANLFDRGVLPFVNIEHIRLAFAMEPLDKAHHRFQHFVIEELAPELLTIPLNSSQAGSAISRYLHQISRAQWLRGLTGHGGWEDYLRGAGRSEVDRVFLADTPLWQILDREKSRKRWQDFLEQGNSNTIFPFSLLAFKSWFEMYIDPR